MILSVILFSMLMWKWLVFASELKFDIQDTVVQQRKWLVELLWKISLFLLTSQIVAGGKINGSVFVKTHWSSHCLLQKNRFQEGLNLDLIYKVSFFCDCTCLNLPYNLPWNITVGFGLVFLISSWICWISYRNGYAWLLVLHLLRLLDPWFSI